MLDWTRDADFAPQRAVVNAGVLPRFVILGQTVRVTRYGPLYEAGMPTASGESYDPASSVALGPELLALAREATGQRWGMWVRISDLVTGKVAIYRVVDSGLDGLEVDLGDELWLSFGYPASAGIFLAKVEVLR